MLVYQKATFRNIPKPQEQKIQKDHRPTITRSSGQTSSRVASNFMTSSDNPGEFAKERVERVDQLYSTV